MYIRSSDLFGSSFYISALRSRVRIAVAAVMSFDDVFGDMMTIKAASQNSEAAAKRRKKDDEGPRDYLRVYETMPNQFLNAYGMCGYHTMPTSKVWEELNKPQRTGAKYATELCSAEEDRRGVGINRGLQVLVEYLKHQRQEKTMRQNEFMLKKDIYEKLYKEVDLIYDAALYCLAGKKQYTKQGASVLRSSVSLDSHTDKKSEQKLKEYSETLYKWIQLEQSRLRMLMKWQSAGGLAFVSWTHIMALQCFLLHGNMCHQGVGDQKVSLEVFQNAILRRHAMQSEGSTYSNSDTVDKDFVD